MLLQYQQTPLHLSASNGHIDIVQMLISQGANIHVKDEVVKIISYVLL